MDQNVNCSSSSRVTNSGAPDNNHSASKLLQTELMALMMSSDKSVTAHPEGDNLFKWKATIKGPGGTVYEGLTYKLSLEFPTSYPFVSPTVKFVTPCFHPNVETSGIICLDILREKRSAVFDVKAILISLQSLLGEPNNKCPLNLDAAMLWYNQEEYKRKLHIEYEKNAQSGSDLKAD